MSLTEEQWGDPETFTLCAGTSVRIVYGRLAGMSGTFVEPRDRGKVLVRLQSGIFVEISPDVLEIEL